MGCPQGRGLVEKMNAEMLMLLGGIAAFVLTIYWVRSRELREKYAVIWLFVASVLLLCGLFPEVVKRTAEAVRLSYPAAVLFVALGVMYVFAFTVSVSLSRQYRRNIRMLQEIALLEHRVRLLESGEKRHDSGGNSG
jgi:hypothetical protein